MAVIWGNWCGRGNKDAPPVDEVDRACMCHDRCYASAKTINEIDLCDRVFMDEVAKYKNLDTQMGRAAWTIWWTFLAKRLFYNNWCRFKGRER